MTREPDADPVCTPERLFGQEMLFTLPTREPVRQVVQVVNRALALNDDPAAYRELLWRLDAAEQQLSELPPGTPEAECLQQIVDTIPLDGSPTSHMRQSLVAYVGYLERDARFADAMAVLSLASRSYGRELPAEDFARFALDVARLNRLQARWERATTCYAIAAHAGGAHEDFVTSLRGQLGCAAVLRGQGKLSDAERIVRNVIAAAGDLSLRHVQFMAMLDLCSVLGDKGQGVESVDAARHALRLSADDEDERTRSLCDLGVSLTDVGAYHEARPLLETAMLEAPFAIIRTNARLELLRIEAALGNRIGFERHREALESVCQQLTPSVAADFGYKLGIGYHQFGQQRLARVVLEEALAIAAASQLGCYRVRIEGCLNRLRGK